MKKRGLVFWVGGAAAVVTVILVLRALILLWLIDNQVVKERIASLLAEKNVGNRDPGLDGSTMSSPSDRQDR